MLTADLAMNWRRGERIHPRLIKTGSADYLRDAEVLIEIYENFQGRTRGELENELEEYVGTGTDYRVLRGLIKLLADRCEFETQAPAEPEEIRRRVFLEARKFQPVTPESAERENVLKSVAAEFNVEGTIADYLYADLSFQQRLVSFESIEPNDLLDRYNLAQAQALLYKCVEMRIEIQPSEAAVYRQIFGAIKRFGLIHLVQGNHAEGYEITLTGAASLFNRSQKYGIRMAVFLPALLLCNNWKMSAEIVSKEKGRAFYELTSEQTELESCYLDEPEYANPVHQKLKKDWEKSAVGWRLEENTRIVDLGKTAFAPDFVLIAPDDARIYLDVLGFWTPKSLQTRLDEFAAAGFHPFILAAWQELRGSREEPLWENENIVFFKSKLEPRVLEDAAEILKAKIDR